MRAALVALLGLFLSACSTPQLPVTEKSYVQSLKLQQHNSELSSWFILAQVSLTTEDKAYHFNTQWQQDVDQYKLRFEAPLASGAIELKGDQDGAELRLNNDKSYRGTDPEQLIRQVTPFNIPVIGLNSWVRGIAHRQSQNQIEINANGTTKNIQQDGWLIEYKDWETTQIAKSEYQMPSDIRLTHPTMHIRIRPSSWQPQQHKVNPIFSDLE